ncbi:MAG: hypothetical protein OCD01_11795 [Fibrobacterales bacterium]
MKSNYILKIYLIIFLLVGLSFPQNQTQNNTPSPKVKFLESEIQALKINNNKLINLTSQQDDQPWYKHYQPIVTAVISILGLLLTAWFATKREKTNIIRKARIEWIQSLRKAYAEYDHYIETAFVSFKSKYKSIDEALSQVEKITIMRDYAYDNGPIYLDAGAKSQYVLLHLKPEIDEVKNDHSKFRKLIVETFNILDADNILNLDFNATDELKNLAQEASIVLNEAWNTAKN